MMSAGMCLDGPIFVFVGLDEFGENVKAIRLGRAAFRNSRETGCDLGQRPIVVGFSLDLSNIQRNLLRVDFVVFFVRADEFDEHAAVSRGMHRRACYPPELGRRRVQR